MTAVESENLIVPKFDALSTTRHVTILVVEADVRVYEFVVHLDSITFTTSLIFYQVSCLDPTATKITKIKSTSRKNRGHYKRRRMTILAMDHSFHVSFWNCIDAVVHSLAF